MSVDLSFEDFLGPPRTLLEWITQCKVNRGLGHRLLYRDTDRNGDILGSTELFPITGDTCDLTDDEYDWFDSSIDENGFSPFLALDQIEDVVDNLAMQKPEYTDAELLDAVNFYFERDAFVMIGRA